MPKQEYPASNPPATRRQGGSLVRVIEKDVAEVLGIEEGEAPEEILYDPEERSIEWRFGGE